MSNICTEEIKVYQAKVIAEFASLKSIHRFDELVSCSIRLADEKGYLLCVSELYAEDEDLIAKLAQWREEATTFHNQFKVTLEGTKRWLRKLVLDVPDRILFLVVNCYGHPIGHLGFANSLNEEGLMELDNVIRGVQGVERGIMSYGVKSLLNWAESTIIPKGFCLRTLQDNTHAINFYTNLGFIIEGKQPLRRVESNGEINHIPLSQDDQEPPDNYFVCMKYVPKTL
jgi:hypothetical protein